MSCDSLVCALSFGFHFAFESLDCVAASGQVAPRPGAVSGGHVDLGASALGGGVIDCDLGGDMFWGGAVLARKPALPAQVATRAESATWGS